jgi:hypothetical protein
MTLGLDPRASVRSERIQQRNESRKQKAESRNGRFPIVSSLNFSFQLSSSQLFPVSRDLRPEGRAGARSEPATYAAFLQNAKNVAGSIPRVGTLGWYAMPLQGMGSET